MGKGMKRIILIMILAIGLDSSRTIAGNIGGGETYEFLKLGGGARALGMGNAYVAMADDASAIYWNPAGLGLLKKNEVYCFYRPAVIDEVGEQYWYGSFVFPYRKFGFGISGIYLGVNDIEKTGIGDYDEPIILGEFEDRETALFLSIGREWFKNLSYLGINWKLINHTLDEETGRGFGVDIGYLTNLSESWNLGGLFKKIKFGAVIRYMGDKKWGSGHKDSGNIEEELGFAWVPVSKDNENFKWTLAGSIKQVKDKATKPSLGTELLLGRYMALRAGYNKDKKLTLGCGLNSKKFNIDYAVAPSPSGRKFDPEQQISLRYKF